MDAKLVLVLIHTNLCKEVDIIIRSFGQSNGENRKQKNTSHFILINVSKDELNDILMYNLIRLLVV